MESTPTLATPTQQRLRARGFTLVEMMVVLAIISIISAITVLGQGNFNKSILLTETAYGVAFSARQAQTFGISSRKFQTFQNTGYGLHFDKNRPNDYLIFADISRASGVPSWCPVGTIGQPDEKPGNCVYDTSSTADGVVSSYQFSRGFTIKNFCVKSASLGLVCSDNSPLQSLDVVFTRPNTTTTIAGIAGGAPTPFTCAVVTLVDSSGQNTKSIRFSSLGEISITDLGCP